MAFTYESMESIIPNAVMRKRIYNGDLLTYLIKPTDGYALHDTSYDVPVQDPITMEDTGVLLGYRTTEGSVGANYDFTTTEMLDEAGNTVTAYGERQFFCKPITEVPENQLYNTDPETETI